MIRVAVVGATGYTGEEIVRILSGHPGVRITYLSRKEERTQKIQEIFPYLKGRLDLDCGPFSPEEAAKNADAVFLSLPHTVSMQWAPFLLERGKRVIDISADYRLKNPKEYARTYGVEHRDPDHLKEAIYGLPELHRSKIRSARLVANPGCYATAALLGLLPFLQEGVRWNGPCVIDAKSGVTGAGRKAQSALLFSEVNENFKAYKVMTHPHEPEILQVLADGAGAKPSLVFVPHLVPLDRGILCTLYLPLGNASKGQNMQGLLEKAYDEEPFIHVLPPGNLPELKHVLRTNQCHLGVATREDQGMAVVITVIDNLGKGAAGQAVQNMNLMFGLDERMGLI